MRKLSGVRGEAVNDQEFMVHTADGRRVVLSSTARPLRDRDQQIVGAVAVFRETTEKRRLEAALHNSETVYRTIARNRPSSVLLLFDRASVRGGLR